MEQRITAANTQTASKRSLLDILFKHGFMTQGNHQKALDDIMPPAAWGYWIAKVLTILGTTMLLLGGIYLVLFNWGKFSYMDKFIVLHAGMIFSICAAFLIPSNTLNFKIFLAACCVMLAILLGVCAQAFQTADGWYWYGFLWVALSLGWVICARLESVWLMWLVVANASGYLWWVQSSGHFTLPFFATELGYYSCSLMINAIILMTMEIFHKRLSWLSMRTIRPAAVSFCCYLALMQVMLVGNQMATFAWNDIVIVLSNFAVLLYFMYFYRYRSLSVWALSLTLLTISMCFINLLFRVFDNIFQLPLPATVVALALISLLLFALVSLYVKRVYTGGQYA